MADKLLKSIKFPTLPDRYVIGDSTLTEEGAAADAKAVGEALATKADTKGTYEDLIVGGAEQLMADGHESDSDPYLFRPTGGSADVGNREYVDKIVGGTVAWNQLSMDTFASGSGQGVTWVNNGDGSWTINGTATGATYIWINNERNVPDYIKPNHKYILIVGKNKDARLGGQCHLYGDPTKSYYVTYPQDAIIISIPDSVESYTGFAWVIGFVKDQTYTDVVVRPQMFDLTALFGTTIADYIYSLEQSQAGAGVAWFRNYFPKDYYPYDPGTLRSVEGVSAHEMVGFNQWDEEWEVGAYNTTTGAKISGNNVRSKNMIRIVPNMVYRFTSTATTSALAIPMFFYDGNGEFISYVLNSVNSTFITPSNAQFMTFYCGQSYGTTYNNDICINLSDPTRNGEYEPHTKHTYPLDSSLTLRGVPKLVDGKLEFDGDVYPPSGEVQRRYGMRAYQSGDESLADAITDGANTVYKLATPTTETADVYEQYQICDPSGTEEFATTGIIPIGHETRYPHDLKKKIETAPDSPSTDGAYLMKRSGGKNAYMALPSTPSANGAYVLTMTVSGGTASYSWTAKE